MNQVTTISAFSPITEKAREQVKSDIFDFLYNLIAHHAEGLKEAEQKESELFKEIKKIIPKDKSKLLLEYDEARNEVVSLQTEAIIEYLLLHGEELNKAVFSF